MRAERISALNNLTALLSEGYSEPVVVTDVKGVIFTMSEKLKNRISKEADMADIKNITAIRSDIKLNEVLSFIEKQHSAWTSENGSRITCTPVFGKKNTVQFCIWEFESSMLAEKFKEISMNNHKIQPSYRKIRNILKPFRRERKP